jgi:hypothetical protein
LDSPSFDTISNPFLFTTNPSTTSMSWLEGRDKGIDIVSNEEGLGVSARLLMKVGDASNSYTISSFGGGRTDGSVTSSGRPTSVGDLSDPIRPNVGEHGDGVLAAEEVGDMIPVPSNSPLRS